jgi:hypothetical protein
MQMEASRAEGRSGYLDFSRLSPGELFGMAAGLVLFVSLWLPWFTTRGDNPNSRLAGATGGDGVDAWRVFSRLDVLLVLAATAPFILSWIILGRPGDSVDIGLGTGYFVALIASAGMLVAGYLRQAVYGDARKPPGVI